MLSRILGIALFITLMAVGASVAKKKDPYEPCTIVSMADVPCGVHGGAGWNRTNDLLSQEYVIRSTTMEYHVRQSKEKHEALLPIGAPAEFLIDKDEIKLRVQGDVHTYVVTSVNALTPAPK
jgi:hypothetical protein